MSRVVIRVQPADPFVQCARRDSHFRVIGKCIPWRETERPLFETGLIWPDHLQHAVVASRTS